MGETNQTNRANQEINREIRNPDLYRRKYFELHARLSTEIFEVKEKLELLKLTQELLTPVTYDAIQLNKNLQQLKMG